MTSIHSPDTILQSLFKGRRPSIYKLQFLTFLLGCFLGCFFFTAQTAVANDASNEVQSVDAIRSLVYDHIYQLNAEQQSESGKTRVIVGHIDERLRLTRCETTPEISILQGTRNSSRLLTEVRCNLHPGWKIYVPVRVTQQRMVISVMRPLKRHDRIAREDITLVPTSATNRSTREYSDESEVIGKLVRKNIIAGTILRPSHIENPKLVKRGQIVQIISRSRGISVQMTGKSLQDGRIGDGVEVQNTSSGRVVAGMVKGPGKVVVTY